MAKESSDIPKDIQKVLRRLERWRSAHTGRLPIPKRLWAAAVELARKHGVSPTAQALHLEYGKLKRLREAAGGVKKSRAAKTPRAGPRRAQSAAPPTFHGTDGDARGRSGGVRDRVGRTARQGSHSVERDDRA